MFLFDLFADFARPFRDSRPQIEDSDDEADASMSLADNASSDLDADIPMSALTCVSNAVATSDGDSTYLPTPPISQYAPPHFDELPMSDDHSSQFSERHRVLRRARSSARHSAYSLPSREQRQAFKRRSRQKKDMFVEGPNASLVPPTEPATVSPTADLDLERVCAEGTETLVNPVDIHLSTQFADQCSVVDSQRTQIDAISTSNKAGRPTKKSGLTIKIPGLVDRLALRLLSSCSVEEQIEDDEDVDSPSLDGYAASESSSSDGDIDDEYNPAFRSSSPVAAPSPDRSSRRKLRRSAAAPYHRAGGKSKRKELWVGADTGKGSEVPTFLLGPPTTERPRTRLRSGCLY